jgi:hypothetical protein
MTPAEATSRRKTSRYPAAAAPEVVRGGAVNVFVGLDDAAWWSFDDDKQEATAGFFVACERARGAAA